MAERDEYILTADTATARAPDVTLALAQTISGRDFFHTSSMMETSIWKMSCLWDM